MRRPYWIAEFGSKPSDISVGMARGSRKPVIGLSLGLHDFGDYGGVGFQRPLALSGGVGMVLPRASTATSKALDACDGILLGGGGTSTSPLRRGADRAPERHRAAARCLRARARRAIARARPANPRYVPRIQILNVALGGTLVQDLALKPEWAEHPSDRGWKAWKEVEASALDGDAPMPAHPRHRSPSSQARGSTGRSALTRSRSTASTTRRWTCWRTA